MSDKRERELERQAATGDRQAAERLREYRRQITGFQSIFTRYVGCRVYLEAGPNFAECGVIREEFLDELGRAVAVLDECRRKNDETTEGGPSWLLDATDEVLIPSTAVTLLQPAEKRWRA